MSAFLGLSQFNKSQRTLDLVFSFDPKTNVGQSIEQLLPSPPTNKRYIPIIDYTKIKECCKRTDWSFLLYKNNVKYQIEQVYTSLNSVIKLNVLLVHYKLSKMVFGQLIIISMKKLKKYITILPFLNCGINANYYQKCYYKEYGKDVHYNTFPSDVLLASLRTKSMSYYNRS